MVEQIAAAAGFAMVLSTVTPVFAQVETPSAQTERQLIDIPVYSSDGQHLGRVSEVAMSDGLLRGVRAELGDTLGIGTATVLIGSEVLEQKKERLEIKMTAGQIRDVLIKQKQRKQ